MTLAPLAACGPPDPTGLDDPVTLEERRLPPAVDRTHSSRFGLDASSPGGGQPSLPLPAGWEQLPPRQFRDLNFRPAGDPELECYATVLGGDGGGELANVNRWRGQVGLPPTDAFGLDELERVEFLGVQALFLDLEGTFTPMGGEPRDDWRVVGLIASAPGQAVTLKMTGPSAKVGPEVSRFLEIARTISEPGDEPPGPPQDASVDLTWEAPEGWALGPQSPARLATFVVESSPGIDVSIISLPGEAGGIRGNLDRWQGQMGLPPLTEAEFTDLERRQVLGATAVLVEANGHYRGMGNVDLPNARLTGAIVPRPDALLFVKMTGPREAVEAEGAAFRSLLASLRRTSSDS